MGTPGTGHAAALGAPAPLPQLPDEDHIARGADLVANVEVSRMLSNTTNMLEGFSKRGSDVDTSDLDALDTERSATVGADTAEDSSTPGAPGTDEWVPFDARMAEERHARRTSVLRQGTRAKCGGVRQGFLTVLPRRNRPSRARRPGRCTQAQAPSRVFAAPTPLTP